MLDHPYKILLICSATSTGKSTLAKEICKAELNFIKLNTKLITHLTHEQLSKKNFNSEMQEASLLLKTPIKTIREILLQSRISNDKHLLKIQYAIECKLKKTDPQEYFNALYKNYYFAVQDLIENGKNCVIDHNIFLDPYPSRKNIFIEIFNQFEDHFKILNIYSNFESIISNTLTRNRRFYNLVSSEKSIINAEKRINHEDLTEGYSFSVFRQPIRVLENFASMYKIGYSEEENQTLEKISGTVYNEMISIIKYEQEKLIGFIIYKNFPFTHIKNEELIDLSREFDYLRSFPKLSFLSISEKRFNFNYQIINIQQLFEDHNLNIIIQLLKNWPNKQKKITLTNSLYKEEYLKKMVQEISYRKKYKVKNITIKKHIIINEYGCSYFIIENFLENQKTYKIIKNIAIDIIHGKPAIIIGFPVSDTSLSYVLINSKNKKFIELKFICANKNIKPENYDQNLLFIGRLYALLANMTDTVIHFKITKSVNKKFF